MIYKAPKKKIKSKIKHCILKIEQAKAIFVGSGLKICCCLTIFKS